MVNPVEGYTPLEGTMVAPGESAMCLYKTNDILSVRIETVVNNSDTEVDASTLNVRKVVTKFNTITEDMPEDDAEQAGVFTYNGLYVCDTLEEVVAKMGSTANIRNNVLVYTYTNEVNGVMTNVELGFKDYGSSEEDYRLTDISVEVITADVPTTGAL